MHKPIAFSAIMPLIAKRDVASLVGQLVDVYSTLYYAEAGVAKQWRRKNISMMMHDLVFTMAAASNF